MAGKGCTQNLRRKHGFQGICLEIDLHFWVYPPKGSLRVVGSLVRCMGYFAVMYARMRGHYCQTTQNSDDLRTEVLTVLTSHLGEIAQQCP